MRPLDMKGAALSGVGLSCIVFGFTILGRGFAPVLVEAAIIGVGAAALTAGGGLFNNIRTAITGRDAEGNRVGLGERYLRTQAATFGLVGGVAGGAVNAATGAYDATKLATSDRGMQVLMALPDRISAAIRGTPITATVAPTDAAQAASRAPAPGR